MFAVVTGGSRGIGFAIASKLSENGYKVALVARDTPRLEQATQMIPNSFSLSCDLSDAQKIRELGRKIAEFGHPVVLVNAAGIVDNSLLLRMTDSTIQGVIQTNLMAPIALSKLIAPYMFKQRHGCIINIASVIGPLKAGVGQSLYATSKAGLVGFTKSLALEMAPRNVRINAILPGYIDTEMTTNLRDIEARIPLGRVGKVEEVADAAMYLVNASYITGQCLVIDGGITL